MSPILSLVCCSFVQAAIRGYFASKKYQAFRQSVRLFQARYRYKAVSLMRNMSAVFLQKHIRRWLIQTRQRKSREQAIIDSSPNVTLVASNEGLNEGLPSQTSLFPVFASVDSVPLPKEGGVPLSLPLPPPPVRRELFIASPTGSVSLVPSAVTSKSLSRSFDLAHPPRVGLAKSDSSDPLAVIRRSGSSSTSQNRFNKQLGRKRIPDALIPELFARPGSADSYDNGGCGPPKKDHIMLRVRSKEEEDDKGTKTNHSKGEVGDSNNVTYMALSVGVRYSSAVKMKIVKAISSLVASTRVGCRRDAITRLNTKNAKSLLKKALKQLVDRTSGESTLYTRCTRYTRYT